MKHVAMFVYGPLLPIAMGSQRVIIEIAKYIHSLDNVNLHVVMIAKPHSEDKYLEICDKITFIAPIGRWNFWSILNKFASRLGIDVWSTFFNSIAYRKRVVQAVGDCDYLLLNYAAWAYIVPRHIRTEKTIVITHDILFYRKASFARSNGTLTKISVKLNKYFEMRVLRNFYKVGVFADYERAILLAECFHVNRIIQLGMPISIKKMPSAVKVYDFVFAGGNSFQNEAGVKCFFDRVIPILGNVPLTIAIAGSLCDSNIWSKLEVPKSVRIIRLGRVDDLGVVFANGLIGIGTVPYGSGIKVKVVESILSGLPMVLTNSGEEGIPVLREAVVNIDRDSMDNAADKLKAWLGDKELAIEVGSKGAQWLKRFFEPSVALKGLGLCIKEGAEQI